MANYKINKEDANKTILNYTNDAHQDECSSDLKINDRLQTKISDFALSFYAEHLPKALRDMIVEGVKIKGELKKLIKDIATGNVAFYDDSGNKISEEKVYNKDEDRMVINFIDDLIEDSYRTLNSTTNKNRYNKAKQRLSEIKGKSSMVDKCDKFIKRLYQSCLLIPSVVYIGSTNDIQLRWNSSDNVTVFVRINLNHKNMEGYISFNTSSKAIDIDFDEFDSLFDLIVELKMYGV